MDILKDLKERGLVYQSTDEELLNKRLLEGPMTLYCGFDPTADSLHIGHLLPVLTLRRFQKAGHCPIALVGGGTGLIGDPSGKKSERSLNSQETVQMWSSRLRNQLSQFLDFTEVENKAIMANNYEWLGSLSMIEFMRDIGKHFSVAAMLARDAVESRLSKGISYTEFSYVIMQSYDYLQLNERYGCELQIGGSDQWGNIVAGMDLIRRMSPDEEKKVHCLTMPLVTKADGTKFGKTEGGAVWLDPQKTSPYQFYQFWLNTDDRDVVEYLKFFTFLPIEEINALAEIVETVPEKRSAQKALAREVTELVHGTEAMERAERISALLFSGGLKQLSAAEIEEGLRDVPSLIVADEQISLVEVLVQVGAVSSKRQAREGIQTGSVYINDVRHTELESMIDQLERIENKYIVIRRGKKSYFLIKLGD